MKRSLAWSLLALFPLVAACGDDGSASTDTDESSSTSTGGETTGTPTTETPATGSTSTNPTTGTSTSSSTSGVDGSESSTTSDTDEPTGSTTGGEEIDCDAIPEGPFAPTVQFMPFSGSEDLVFDGQGGLAGKSGNSVIVVDADGNETASYVDSGPAYGLRYTIDGDLLVAHFQTGVIAQIASDGSSTEFATGIGGVNGLYADFDGRVWVTDFSSVRRFETDGSLTSIVTGGDGGGANGIVYDPDRGVAFFTNYGAGRLAKVEIADDGSPGAITPLATVGGALFDGLSLDVCGNLYGVDNGNARVYRVMLDENADALGDATDIVDGNMQNIANAQFGQGEGFDPNSLYAAGNPGVVYRIEVGVPGAPVPTP